MTYNAKLKYWKIVGVLDGIYNVVYMYRISSTSPRQYYYAADYRWYRNSIAHIVVLYVITVGRDKKI